MQVLKDKQQDLQCVSYQLPTQVEEQQAVFLFEEPHLTTQPKKKKARTKNKKDQKMGSEVATEGPGSTFQNFACARGFD